MNILDTRDLQKRLDELEDAESDLDNAKEAVAEAKAKLVTLREELKAASARRDAAAGSVDEDEAEVAEDLADTAVANAEEELEEAQEELDGCEAEFDEDARAELKELREMESEVPDWRFGETLIDEEDFEDYCRELVVDIGVIPKDLPDYIVIDWEATAENLKADYSECEYLGATYLYRDC